MSKQTKAQARKRLKECAVKLSGVFLHHSEAMTVKDFDAIQKILVKVNNRLM